MFRAAQQRYHGHGPTMVFRDHNAQLKTKRRIYGAGVG
jgi:hypothetical protein